MAYNSTNPNGQATMANSTPVVLASNQSALPVTMSSDASVTLAISSATYLTTAALTGASVATIQVSGTWAGTLLPQASVDGSNYVTLGPTSLLNLGSGTYTASISSGSTGLWQADVSGFGYFRLNMTTYTSGTANVTIKTSNATGMVALDAPIPGGTNTLGSVKVTDGTNTPAVKAASTAPVAADPALVVAMSPNSTLPVSNTDVLTTLSIASATNSNPLTLNGQSVVTVHLTGTWTANVQIQIQADGSSWTTVYGSNILQNAVTGAYVPNGTMTANGIYQMDVAGFAGVRVAATSYTSGTITGAIRASVGAGAVAIEGTPTVTLGSSTNTVGSITSASSTGAAVPTTAFPSGMSDGTNLVIPRLVTSTNNTTGTGLLGTAALGQYNTSLPTVTAGNYSTMQTDSNGRLMLGTSAATIGTVTLGTGGNVIGSVTLNTSANTIGYVGLDPLLGSTGLTASSTPSLTNTVVYVKATAARMFEYDFYNPNSTGVWVQIFNAGTGVTLGTTVATRTIYIPATSGRDWASPYSIALASGLAIACTTTNTGSTAPTSAIQAYVGYV